MAPKPSPKLNARPRASKKSCFRRHQVKFNLPVNQTPIITVTDGNAYRQALLELDTFKTEVGHQYRGRFVQIFLAMKFYQNELPSMFSNQYISTEVLQTL